MITNAIAAIALGVASPAETNMTNSVSEKTAEMVFPGGGQFASPWVFDCPGIRLNRVPRPIPRKRDDLEPKPYPGQ